MALPQDHISMALFCDFENVALGVREANYDKFDIKKVLERLLLKGSIVVKKAYCDWERYRGFKAAMHEANFELIEIPHVRQSGKNSADIRMVVDALDLCYTKAHVNTFVIISGDSDFSPLVSKLRENAKFVIGVGVKQSTSDLLIANCDEFIFYDDLVRGSRRDGRDARGEAQPQQRRSPEEEAKRKAEVDSRRTKAVELAAETYEALVTDRDEGGRIWASVLKEAIKRRNPGFNENYYGFRTFGNLLEEARARGLLDFGRDEKSGTFVSRGTGVPTAAPATGLSNAPGTELMAPTGADAPDDAVAQVASALMAEDADDLAAPKAAAGRSRSGRGRRSGGRAASSETSDGDTHHRDLSARQRRATAAEDTVASPSPAPRKATSEAGERVADQAADTAVTAVDDKPTRQTGRKTTGRGTGKKSAPRGAAASTESADNAGAAPTPKTPSSTPAPEVTAAPSAPVGEEAPASEGRTTRGRSSNRGGRRSSTSPEAARTRTRKADPEA